jgi:hypothetical protein
MDRADTLALKKYLQANSYKPEDALWMTFTRLDYSARSDNFLVRMAKEPDQFIREIVDKPWRLFTLTANYLHTINQTTLSQHREQPNK